MVVYLTKKDNFNNSKILIYYTIIYNIYSKTKKTYKMYNIKTHNFLLTFFSILFCIENIHVILINQ